jgi:hypothetical protein
MALLSIHHKKTISLKFEILSAKGKLKALMT